MGLAGMTSAPLALLVNVAFHSIARSTATESWYRRLFPRFGHKFSAFHSALLCGVGPAAWLASRYAGRGAPAADGRRWN
jgi:hypothetical protein